MSKFDILSGRALQIASEVGDAVRDRVPDRAIKWIETGAALGALKTGTRVAGKLVRRNPMVAVAAAAGAGLLLYAVRRHQKKQQAGNGAIEGSSRRVEAKKAPPRTRPATAKRARKTTGSSGAGTSTASSD